nr:immunoglobulin heavy chain junction region [Mus musculus]
CTPFYGNSYGYFDVW